MFLLDKIWSVNMLQCIPLSKFCPVKYSNFCVVVDSRQCAATQSVKTGQDLCLTSTNHAMWISRKFVYRKHKQSCPGAAFLEGLSHIISLFFLVTFLILLMDAMHCDNSV